jgi:xanthine dehydrogenase accessory factor
MVLDDILEAIERWDAIVRVTITHGLGSTPREVGADMIVSADQFKGSIGGGKLEYLALEKARTWLQKGAREEGPWPRQTENFVLGTELRQCCGGVVWLLLEYFDAGHRQALLQQRQQMHSGAYLIHEIEAATPLLDTTRNLDFIEKTALLADALKGAPTQAMMLKDQNGRAVWFVEPAKRATVALVIYGAGHVGRAVVRVLEGTPFHISWVDINTERFPADVRDDIHQVTTPSPADYASTTEPGAFHVVMTHSHEIDLDICRTVLKTGQARFLGLIGSETKKTKFINRLRKDGVPDSALNVFHCPVGLGDWSSKLPSVIAISVAAQLVDVYEQGLAALNPRHLKQIHAVGGSE